VIEVIYYSIDNTIYYCVHTIQSQQIKIRNIHNFLFQNIFMKRIHFNFFFKQRKYKLLFLKQKINNSVVYILIFVMKS